MELSEVNLKDISVFQFNLIESRDFKRVRYECESC